ncbi:hypothetical protein BV20DRAFT_1052132 [Pilatotrama ljubarskyi]|nr:hypothetical protein BV20DRAFT_1052132 [Pilatotrama ljubarskyi]
MPRFALATVAFVLTLALSALAGPVPRARAVADLLPSQAFTFAPHRASDPLPAPTKTPGLIPLHMDWLS